MEIVSKYDKGKILIYAPCSYHMQDLRHYVMAFLKHKAEIVHEFKLKSLLESSRPFLYNSEQNDHKAQLQISTQFMQLKDRYETFLHLDSTEAFPTLPFKRRRGGEEELILKEHALDSMGYAWNENVLDNWEILIDDTNDVGLLHDKQPTAVILYGHYLHLIKEIQVFNVQLRSVGQECIKDLFILHDAEGFDVKHAEYTESLENELMKELQSFLSEFSVREFMPVQIQDSIPTVIVDKREFASPIPYELHKIGVRVVPATLTVGDYILTPDLCIERKSASTDDLAASLNSGRLSQQVQNMKQCYERVCLLIEFSEDTDFGVGSGSGSYSFIQAKLTKLFLEKGGFQILWTHSPSHTASLILKLKERKPEPILNQALKPKTVETSGRRNENAWAFLYSIPYMTDEVIHALSSNYESLVSVSKASKNELCILLGDKCGSSVYNYLEEKYVNHRLN